MENTEYCKKIIGLRINGDVITGMIKGVYSLTKGILERNFQ